MDMENDKRKYKQGFVEGYNDSMYGASSQFPQGARYVKSNDIPFAWGYRDGYRHADYEMNEQTVVI